MYPLLRRVVSRYNEDKSGALTFSEFSRALSTLSAKATLDEKLQFAFALYDVNGNGRISADEMFDVFRLMSPRNYTDDALQQIVSAFMAEYPQAPPHLPTCPPAHLLTAWPSTRHHVTYAPAHLRACLTTSYPPNPPTYFMAEYPQGLEFEDFSHVS